MSWGYDPGIPGLEFFSPTTPERTRMTATSAQTVYGGTTFASRVSDYIANSHPPGPGLDQLVWSYMVKSGTAQLLVDLSAAMTNMIAIAAGVQFFAASVNWSSASKYARASPLAYSPPAGGGLRPLYTPDSYDDINQVVDYWPTQGPINTVSEAAVSDSTGPFKLYNGTPVLLDTLPASAPATLFRPTVHSWPGQDVNVLKNREVFALNEAAPVTFSVDFSTGLITFAPATVTLIPLRVLNPSAPVPPTGNLTVFPAPGGIIRLGR